MDLEDLETRSISDMSQDEAIEYLRQLRLSRRTPAKVTKRAKALANKKPKTLPKLKKQDAADLLKLLGG